MTTFTTPSGAKVTLNPDQSVAGIQDKTGASITPTGQTFGSSAYPASFSGAMSSGGVTVTGQTPTGSPTTTPVAPKTTSGIVTNADGTITYQSTNPSAPNYKAPDNANTPDTTFSTAKSNLAPTTPQTPEDFYNAVYSKLQPVLSKISDAEMAAETAATNRANQTLSSLNFGANARGLAGSSEATAEAGQVELQRGADVAQALQTQATALQSVAQFAIPEAYSEFVNAQSRNDALSSNYIATSLANAKNSIKSLAETGKTIDSLATDNPVAYNTLLQYYGGDVNTMKADWIAGASAQSLDGGKPIQAGTHLIYTFKDPVTGKTFTQDIDTGVSLTQDWKTVTGKDGTILQYNQATGETKQLTSADPYYVANQAATLESKKAMLTSRYGTAVNNITKQLFPTPTSNPMNLYSSSLNWTSKLKTAYTEATDPNNDNKGAADLELVDTAIKINNGGQQITEAQFNAFNNSLGALGEAKLSWDKFQAALGGGNLLLTQGQRDSIHKLASENVKAQKSNAENAAQVVAERAIRAGVPANMVSTVDDIQALSAASNPTADSSTQSGTVLDSNGNQVQITVNPDGTYTDSNGVNYDAQGNEI